MQTASRPFLPDARHVPASAEFGLICRLLLQRKGDFADLADFAEQRQLPGRVQRALKAAIPASHRRRKRCAAGHQLRLRRRPGGKQCF